MDNRNEISKNSASWFRNRARSFQQTQKKNTYNLKDKQGNLYFSPSRSQSVRSSKTSGHYQKVQQAMPSTLAKKEASAGVLMPPKLEKLRAEVMLAGWPRGTALEFLANHVFVVHEPSMTKKVRALLDKTHVWRNRRIFIDAAFPVLTQRAADGLEGTGLSASQAARHRKGSTMMPEAFIQARGGSWGEIFVGRMHTVISGAWAPDRSSPPVHVYWKGARLALQPRLGPGDDMMVDLRWKQHRLSNVAPRVVAGTILQQPVDSTWATDKPFLVKPGRSALTGMHGHEGSLQALLLMVRAR